MDSLRTVHHRSSDVLSWDRSLGFRLLALVMPPCLARPLYQWLLPIALVSSLSIGCHGSDDPQGSNGETNSPEKLPTWSWESPSPLGSDLFAIQGTVGAAAPDDVFIAVGDPGVVLEKNRSGFQFLTPKGASRPLLAVSPKNADGEMLAVGSGRLVAFFSSGRWNVIDPFLGVSWGDLTAVVLGSNPDEFFVFGRMGQIYHVTNHATTWTLEDAGIGSLDLHAAWARGTGSSFEIFAVGQPIAGKHTILRRDAAGVWSKEVSVPASGRLLAIAGDETPQGTIYVAGEANALLQRTGVGTWKDLTISLDGGALAGVTITSVAAYNDQVIIAGSKGTSSFLARQSNPMGSTWKQDIFAGGTPRIFGFWQAKRPNGQNALYAVGQRGVILREENSSWVKLTSEPATTSDLNHVWADSTEVIAVGTKGAVLTRTLVSDQVAWVSVPASTIPTTDSFFAIGKYEGTKLGQNDLFVVGENGTIVHRKDGRWIIEGGVLTSRTLRAVRVGSDGLVYVGGDGGFIGRRDPQKPAGNEWGLELPMFKDKTGTPGYLNDDVLAIWADPEQADPKVYFGGRTSSGGFIIHRNRDGSYSQDTLSVSTEEIVSIFGDSEDNLYAMGSAGSLFYHKPLDKNAPNQVEQWVRIRIISGSDMVKPLAYAAGIRIPSSNDLVTLGVPKIIDGTTPFVFTGKDPDLAWSMLPTIPVKSTIRSVAARAKNDIFVVGSAGTILHFEEK